MLDKNNSFLSKQIREGGWTHTDRVHISVQRQ